MKRRINDKMHEVDYVQAGLLVQDIPGHLQVVAADCPAVENIGFRFLVNERTFRRINNTWSKNVIQ